MVPEESSGNIERKDPLLKYKKGSVTFSNQLLSEKPDEVKGT